MTITPVGSQKWPSLILGRAPQDPQINLFEYLLDNYPKHGIR